MTKLSAILLAVGMSSVALAGGKPQTHHCKMADGTTDATKTKKQCKEAKGTWAKDDAAAAAPAAAPPADKK